jgi:H+-transporting ATPase
MTTLEITRTPFVTSEGLTSAEAAERLQRIGPNAVTEIPEKNWLVMLKKFWGVVPWMLEAAIIIDLILGRWAEGGVIAALLVFQALLGYYQERRGKRAVALLRSQLKVNARVRRDGQWQVIPAPQLVPDDLVHLRVGDIVPADIQLNEGVIALDQSQLTGESLPVEAKPGLFAYTGSRVVHGEASGIVTATADRTHFGKTAQLVQLARAPRRLQLLTVQLAKYLFALDALIIAIVVIGLLLQGASMLNALPFILMLLVASVPVALPSFFTMSAAMGASMLAKNGVMTTRLSAVEDAATMDVLCVDKTGTITENHLSVSQLATLSSSTLDEVLRIAALASSESTQDPLDVAILHEARTRGVLDGKLPEVLHFEPFDPATKRSEVDYKESDGKVTHVLKGEPVTLAELVHVPWDQIKDEVARLSEDGSRVLAIASGTNEDLHLIGLVALADQPRAESAKLVSDLNKQGVKVVLVTGDGEATARAIAAKVGLHGEVAPAGTLAGELSPGDANRYTVFAGVLPEHKFRLVQALQKAGHVVGMTGDGVNDAPALSQADVGIAVSTATDVAKASASLVLTRPGLSEILMSIKASRTIYQRMQTWVLAMLARKAAIPPFLALALLLWGVFALSPLLVVLFMLLGDVATFAMSTDRVVPSNQPDIWAVRSLIVKGLSYAAVLFAASLVVFWAAYFGFHLPLGQAQTAAFFWLVLAGGQSALYVARSRGAFWAKPYPGKWLLWASLFDLVVAAILATLGWLMSAISLVWIGGILLAAIAYLAIGNGLGIAVSALFRPPAPVVGGE